MHSKAAAEKEFVNTIAEYAASCVEEAVDRWMAELDSVLQDSHLTTLGRLQAVSAIVSRYRHLRGGAQTPESQTSRVAGWGIC